MARFRYSLQSVLNIKLKMENQARQEFASARARLDAEEEKLLALVRRKEEYEAEASELRKGTLDLLRMEENQAAVVVMDSYIAAQEAEVEKAENYLETQRAHLAELMMERKTFETLREKAFQQFLEDEKRAESKMVDELVSYTYAANSEE